MTAALVGQELVVYVWAAADGPSGAVARLGALFDHCVDELRMTMPIAGLPPDRPADADLTSAATSAGDVLAIRESPDAGVHQIVLRQVRDVLVLGLLRSPDTDDPRGWRAWEHEWERLLGEPDPGWLGSVRILQGRRSGPGTHMTIDEDLHDRVRDAAGPVGPWSTGVVERPRGLGEFAVWETSPPSSARRGWDQRPHRRLVVVAPGPHDDLLSAWTWSRGAPEQTPLAAYLLQVAVLRHTLRVASADEEHRALLRTADAGIAALIGQVGALDPSPADGDALTAAATRVRTQQAHEVGLITAIGAQRRLVSAAGVATRNMAAYVSPDLVDPGGVFADDAALATWLAAELRTWESSLQERLDRGTTVTEQADRLVQRRLQERAERLQRRRERFNLAATGAVGAVLMCLAAIQALAYRAPVPDPVKGPVVAVLGAFALLCSALVLRAFATLTRWWPLALVALTGGLFGASAGWCLVSALASDRAAPPAETGLGAGVGAAVALVAVAVVVAVRTVRKVHTRRGRARGDDDHAG